MRLTGLGVQRFASRLGLLGLMAVLLALPYALPPLAERLLGQEPGQWVYLVKPVENQAAFLPIALFCLATLYFALRAVGPGPADQTSALPRNSLPWLALLFVGCQFLSIFVSPSPGASLRVWLLPFSGLVGLFILVTARPSRASLEKLMLISVLAGIPAALYAIAQSQGWEFLPYREVTAEGSLLAEDTAVKQRISSTFGHPNYMASYLAPVVFWCLYFALAKGSRLRRAVGMAGFVILIAAMILGGTRGALLAVAVGMVSFYIALALTPAYRRQLLFAGGVAVVVGLMLLIIPNPFLRAGFDLRERLFASKEVTLRFYFWSVGNRMLADRPVLGVGHGAFDILYFNYASQLQQSPEGPEYEFLIRDDRNLGRAGYLHNDHLQVAVEGGVVTAVAWVALWTAFLAQTLETIRRSRRQAEVALLAAAFLASVGAMGIDALFGFPFLIPVSGFYFWILIGGWAAWRGSGDGSEVNSELRVTN